MFSLVKNFINTSKVIENYIKFRKCGCLSLHKWNKHAQDNQNLRWCLKVLFFCVELTWNDLFILSGSKNLLTSFRPTEVYLWNLTILSLWRHYEKMLFQLKIHKCATLFRIFYKLFYITIRRNRWVFVKEEDKTKFWVFFYCGPIFYFVSRI